MAVRRGWWSLGLASALAAFVVAGALVVTQSEGDDDTTKQPRPQRSSRPVDSSDERSAILEDVNRRMDEAERDFRETSERIAAELQTATSESRCQQPFRATHLPAGFTNALHLGSWPRATVVGTGDRQAVFHYTDGATRALEIRVPATPYVEVIARDDEPADAYVLGQPVLIRPLSPGTEQQLIAQFSFPTHNPDDPCSLFSVNGYDVSIDEMRLFVHGLEPTR